MYTGLHRWTIFLRAHARPHFFADANFFSRTLLERKIKNVRAQLGTQIIFVRSRAANVLDMPSVSESPEDFTNHEATKWTSLV